MVWLYVESTGHGSWMGSPSEGAQLHVISLSSGLNRGIRGYELRLLGGIYRGIDQLTRIRAFEFIAISSTHCYAMKPLDAWKFCL